MAFLQRLLSRLLQVTERILLDVHYLTFVVNHEIMLLRLLLGQVELPQDVVSALTELSMLNIERNSTLTHSHVHVTQGEMGRPKYDLSLQQLKDFIHMSLPVSCIANILGVSKRTV